jgi:hypothetical protein
MEQYLVSLGLPGVVILGLTYAVKTIWNRYSDSQEARIKEGRECVEAISNNTHALEKLTDVLSARPRQ